MRITRHAKNRLRYIARLSSDVSEAELLSKLESAQLVGKDSKGNDRLSVEVGGILLTVIVDPAQAVVVTIWKED